MERLIALTEVGTVTLFSMALALMIELVLLKVILGCVARATAEVRLRESRVPVQLAELRKAGL